MSENVNPPKPKLNGFALRKLADRKTIEAIVGALAAILVTNVAKYVMSLGWFSNVFRLPPSTYFYNNLRFMTNSCRCWPKIYTVSQSAMNSIAQAISN
jgi:hypothetical protein